MSRFPAVSADGRYVAFLSDSTNLVAGDTNGKEDVFVRDRTGGTTTRVSVATGGAQANDWSTERLAISGNGNCVAFTSYATNLVTGDTNSRRDVFVHDRGTGATYRASVANDGSQANEASWAPAISQDGRYIAFTSSATNLVAGDTNGVWDVFVRDRTAGTTRCVDVSSSGVLGASGAWAPAISADGRYVAFCSNSPNLVAGDDNSRDDILVRDLVAGTTVRVSLTDGGGEASGDSASPSIGADGRYVAFSSGAGNLVAGDSNAATDVFVRDRTAQTTRRVSTASNGDEGNDDSSDASVSRDGRYVAFLSDADNLVAGDANEDTDAFLHDCGAIVPAVTLWSPRGTGVPRSANIVLRFSETMRHGTVENALYIDNAKAIRRRLHLGRHADDLQPPLQPVRESTPLGQALQDRLLHRGGAPGCGPDLGLHHREHGPARGERRRRGDCRGRADYPRSHGGGGGRRLDPQPRRPGGRQTQTGAPGPPASRRCCGAAGPRPVPLAPAGGYLVEAHARGEDGTATSAVTMLRR